MPTYLDQHKKNQAGFILFTAVLFMQIFALTAIAQLLLTKMNLKISNDNWQQRQNFDYSYHLLNYIENYLQNHNNCFIPHISPINLFKKNSAWWQQYACHGTLSTTSYYFAVEFLGDNPCALLKNSQQTANFYRLTLLTTNSKFPSGKILISSIFIKPSMSKEECTESVYQVNIGRQSWRQLNG